MPDLLDMAGPQGLPDFSQMSNMTAPQMMPAAPGIGAAVMYGRDAGRHDAMIQEALKAAILRANIQQQQAEEFAAAGPGRRAEIDLKSRQAMDANDDPNSLALPRQDRATKLARSKSEQSGAEQADLSEYMNMLDQALKVGPNPDAVSRIQKQMVRDGITKYRGTDISSLTPEQFATFMNDQRSGMTNTPKDNLQRDIWGNYKPAIVAQQGANQASAADIRGIHAENAARIRAAATSLGYTTPRTAEARIQYKIEHEQPLNDGEKELYKSIQEVRMNAAAIRAAGFNPQAIIDGNGNFKLEKPTVPQVSMPSAVTGGTNTGTAKVTVPVGAAKSNPAQPADKAAYDKLKSGDWYIKPGDPEPRRKP